MELSLDGKVALVTGASRGIGKAIAKACADAGASVMLSSRKQDSLEAAAANTDDAALIAVAAEGVESVLAEGLEHHLFLGRVLGKVRS